MKGRRAVEMDTLGPMDTGSQDDGAYTFGLSILVSLAVISVATRGALAFGLSRPVVGVAAVVAVAIALIWSMSRES